MDDLLYGISDAAKFVGLSSKAVTNYAQIIEEKGYKFSRGIKNDYLFSNDDITLLRRILDRKKEIGKENAINEALSEVMDLSDIEDLSTTDLLDLSSLSGVPSALSDLSRVVKEMDVRQQAYSKLIDELIRDKGDLSDKYNELLAQNKELTDVVKRIESNSIDNDRSYRLMAEKTNKMFQDFLEEVAATKKKGFFARLFGK